MNNFKVIFLDVDGVLNAWGSNSRCCGFTGIDGPKVALLKKIVDATNAKIVLTSSWKSDYEDYMVKGYQNKIGKYLREKLREKGLEIYETTKRYELNPDHRGEAIYTWVHTHHVENFIVLDDEIFEDYEEYGILDHLIKSSWGGPNIQGGLNEELVKEAIEKLIGDKLK